MSQADEPETPRFSGRTALTGAGALVLGMAAPARLTAAEAATASRRVVYNLNPDWRFLKQDIANAHAPSFDDSAWAVVSVPHTFNDVDSFDNHITSSGESAVAMQPVWYRKRFTLPAEHSGQKALLEFEGVRPAATVYVNGVKVGRYENGVAPFGFDITGQVRFGAENLIAVKADNTKWRPEEATGTPFQWDTRDFNPTYGGLTRNVRLHVVPKTYFTLPLYTNLRTTGCYVHASAIDVPAGTATVTVEAQVRNEQSSARTITVAANGGVHLNDKHVFLTGYAIRATNEWAVIGGAVPDWMTDLGGQLIRESKANLIRWGAVDAAEYVGTMLNRHHSDYSRDREPIIECEYTRDEAPRRVWDEHSPPDFGYKSGPEVTYHHTSEDFAGPHAAATRHEFWGQRIQGPGQRRYSGAAALIWADSNQHGRQHRWECCRLSGRVDAVRIPKESAHTYRVVQSDTAPGGLRANDSDIAFFEVEVVDAQGRRMPTHQARVDFTLTGPGRFLGGFNPGKPGSVHKSFVDIEAGVNRVFVRAARTAGTLTPRATASGLSAATVSIDSIPFPTTGGLTTVPPARGRP